MWIEKPWYRGGIFIRICAQLLHNPFAVSCTDEHFDTIQPAIGTVPVDMTGKLSRCFGNRVLKMEIKKVQSLVVDSKMGIKKPAVRKAIIGECLSCDK